MNKYKDGKIYLISSLVNDKKYIGSTIQKLYLRKNDHKKRYRDYKKGLYGHNSSFDIFDDGDYKIDLICNYPCNNFEELTEKEQEIIDLWTITHNIINKRRSNSNKEYRKKYIKEYVKDNKEKISERMKIYHKEHKEQREIKYTCDCGSTLRIDCEARHEKTKKHLKFIENKIKICQ